MSPRHVSRLAGQAISPLSAVVGSSPIVLPILRTEGSVPIELEGPVLIKPGVAADA